MALFQPVTALAPLAAGDKAPIVRYAVDMRQNWADNWTRKKYLSWTSATDAVAPAIGRASLLFHYGRIKREDRNSFQQEYDIDVLEHYVRLLAMSSRGTFAVWYGVIDADILSTRGGATPSGELVLEAFSLAHELDRDVIKKVKVEDGAGSIVEVERVPRINERYNNGTRVFGNRSSARHSDNAYVFSQDGEPWTNKDLIEMILARHTPANGPTFELGGLSDVLDDIVEVHDIAGKSPWQIIINAVPRARGLGIAPVVVNEKVILYVYSILEQELVSGDMRVPGNDNQVEIDLQAIDIVNHPQITRSVASRFDEIEVRGKEILVCGSWGYLDVNLEQRWSNEIEVAYMDAAKNVSGYSSLSGGAKANLNDDFRRADPLFGPVYAKHGLPVDWDGTAGYGDGSGPLVPILPICNDGGEIVVEAGAPFYPLGKHFERFVPLEEGKDYSVDPAVATSQPSDEQPQYMRPFALIQHPTTANKWYNVTKIGEGDEFENVNASFEVCQRGMAVEVAANPRHIYAKNWYDPNVDETSNVAPVFDYTDLLITAALRTDSYLRMVVKRSGLPTGARVKRKLINIDDAELWYIAQNTVIGVNADGTLKRYVGNGLLRDDRARVRKIAALAFAWYGVERAAVNFTVKRVEPLVTLGALITSTIVGETHIRVGTPVTSIEYSTAGDGSSRVQTHWAELDFSGGAI